MVSIKELRKMLEENENELKKANIAIQFGQVKVANITQMLNHRAILKDELIRQLELELAKKAIDRREYQSTKKVG